MGLGRVGYLWLSTGWCEDHSLCERSQACMQVMHTLQIGDNNVGQSQSEGQELLAIGLILCMKGKMLTSITLSIPKWIIP